MAQRHRRQIAGRQGAALAGLLAGLLTSGGREAPLTLAFAGDVSLAREVARVNAGDWAGALSGIREALRADAVAANLESPLTDAPFRGGRIDLRAPPAAVVALGALTHLSVENNHAQDGREAGQRQSRAILRGAGIQPVTRALSVTRVRGVPLAWVAFSDDGHTPLPLAAVREGARRAGLVVVLAHWGEEYGAVTARQRGQAKQLAGAGATLIVGSGPHVLQGHERIGRTLVLYSLGNLLLDQPYPRARLGAVARVQVADALSACAVPTRFRAGRVERATGEDARGALAALGLPACG